MCSERTINEDLKHDALLAMMNMGKLQQLISALMQHVEQSDIRVKELTEESAERRHSSYKAKRALCAKKKKKAQMTQVTIPISQCATSD